MKKNFEVALAQLYASRDSEPYRALERCYGEGAEIILNRTSSEGVLAVHTQHADDPQLTIALEKLGRSMLIRESADKGTFYGIDLVIEILFQAIEETPSWQEAGVINFTPYLESVLAFEGLAALIRKTNAWIVMPNEAAYVLLRLWYDFHYKG